MNAMTNNDQWLYENSPTLYYNHAGVRKSNGTKLMSGVVQLPAGGIYTSATYYFGSFFSAGSRPVVTAGLNSYPQIRIMVAIRGIGTFFPDHRGFEVRVSAAEVSQTGNKIKSGCWVPFTAVGW
jgi:hypothetical protein